MAKTQGKIFGSERRRVEQPASESAPQPSHGSTHGESKPSESDKTERLSFPLTKEGDLDLDSLRSGTREKLRRALHNDKVRAELFGASGPGAPSAARLTPDDLALAGVLYDALGALFVSAARASGYPLDAAEMLRYSEQEKRALIEPTARVFAKYAGNFAYMDELMLGVAFTTITLGKLSLLKKPATVIPFPNATTPSESDAMPVPPTDEQAGA